MRLPLYQVDAFATRPFEGNPAAVVPLPRWLPDPLLQAMAAEHNLSETAYLVREGEAWHLRWFTPATEVELCGHATLASAHVLAEVMGEPGPFAFRTLSGVLRVEREGERLVLDFPARTDATRLDPPPAGLAEALGAAPREVWRARDLICLFDSPAQVVALAPDHARLAALPGPERVIATAPGGPKGADAGVDVTSRYFAIKVGVPEDPVTGAAHVQIVPFWAARLERQRLVCRQASRRGGTLWCELRGDRVRMGGTAVLYARGEILLPEA